MGTICAYLMEDHDYCDALFAEVERSVHDGDWLQAGQAMRRFGGAMQRHIAMEETVLFQAFERRVGHACYPIGMLRAEHRQLELLIQRAGAAVRDAALSAFALHADTLTIVKHQHAAKEDAILYPVLDQLLARERDALLAQMRALRKGERMARALANS